MRTCRACLLRVWRRAACRAGALAVTAVAFTLAGCGGGGGSSASTALVVESDSTSYATKGNPFTALVTGSGAVLVSVSAVEDQEYRVGIELFEPSGTGLWSICVNALPEGLANDRNSMGLTFFPDKANLSAAVETPGIVLFSVANLLACKKPSTGYRVDQGSTDGNESGTFDQAIAPDGKFAFVANEYGVAEGTEFKGNVGVTRIERDASGNFTKGTELLTRIPTGGNAIAGVTLSPDGRRLYVTTEIAGKDTKASGRDNPVLGRTNCVQDPTKPPTINGLLTVVDVAAAEAGKREQAILATVASGCSPVRIDVSADGKIVWVAARGDNRVLAFSAERLEAAPNDALVGYADTGGIAPVGIKLFSAGRLLAVANSNRFDGGKGNLTILDVRDPGNALVVHTVATGLFPRNVTVAPDDSTLYLTNFLSASLQVVRTRVM